MGDYPTDEQLTRLLAIERMKKLSDMYLIAKEHGDVAGMYEINLERVALRQEYMKVIK